jgi:uncharacterized protein (DUF1697 family)
LRGINVGGKNKLAMKDLIALFEAAGCAQVTTYIASGNVIFEASARVARAVPAAVTAAIEARFGLAVPVVIRTAAELDAVVASNPFPDGLDALFVMFLADRPAPARIAALDPARSPGDSFRVVGREIYLHLPNGAARTKLSNAYFDGKLATVSTGRNWRTTLTLRDLARR